MVREYKMRRGLEDGTYMTLGFGSGFMTATVCQLDQQKIQVIKSGSRQMGSWDAVEWFKHKVCEFASDKYGFKLDERIFRRSVELIKACDDIVIQLANQWEIVFDKPGNGLLKALENFGTLFDMFDNEDDDYTDSKELLTMIQKEFEREFGTRFLSQFEDMIREVKDVCTDLKHVFWFGTFSLAQMVQNSIRTTMETMCPGVAGHGCSSVRHACIEGSAAITALIHGSCYLTTVDKIHVG